MLEDIKIGDRVIFSNGHESPVVRTIDLEDFLNIYFVPEKGEELNLYFNKETGEAPGTHYEIAKVIHA